MGLWAGEHGDGEGAKCWLRVLIEIKNRGVRDVLMLVCDGLKGLPDAVNTLWDKTIVQTCVIHLLRNSFKYTGKRDWPELAKDLKLIYTAPSADAALERFADFSDKWDKRCAHRPPWQWWLKRGLSQLEEALPHLPCQLCSGRET